MKKLFLAALIPLLFSACRGEDEIKMLMKNPEIISIGTIEGCTVKYVDRGTDYNSFFLARCPAETSTVTNNYACGKSQCRSTVISTVKSQEEIDRENALNKLTEKERILLNIKE